MKNPLLFYLVLVLLTISCNANDNKNGKSTSTLEEDKNTNGEVRIATSDDLAFLKDNCIISCLQLTQKGDTLRVVSDGELTWRPFGASTTIENIQKYNNNIFDSTIFYVTNPNTQLKEKIIELRFKESYVKINFGSYEEPHVISSRIVNKEIRLAHGIHIGMQRGNFFSTLFKDADDKLMNRFNVIENYDPPGEFIEQTFILNKGRLSEIIFTSPYSWIE